MKTKVIKLECGGKLEDKLNEWLEGLTGKYCVEITSIQRINMNEGHCNSCNICAYVVTYWLYAANTTCICTCGF